MMLDYPSSERQSCGYAIRYLKWLSDSGATQEIGPNAFALLVAVVTKEDELVYSRAPNFYNGQLADRCGIGSEPALIRARKRATEAGLLFYESGAKRRPGRYFVCGFPNESLGKAKGNRRESEGKTAPSIPNTQTPTQTPSKDASLNSRFEEFWEAYPPRNRKRLGKKNAVKEFAKIKPADIPDLMRAVRAYAGSGQMPKDAERFLKNDYWRDWLPTATTSSAPSNRIVPIHQAALARKPKP